MATIKSYSDLEQSKVLAKILPLESADMYWQSNLNSSDRQYLLDMGEEEYFDIEINFEHCSIGDYDIPAWSLAALLNILHSKAKDIPSLSGGGYKDGEYISDWCLDYEFENGDYQKTFADNPVDVCVAMIEKLHELNLL